jgi:putative redox protein
MAITTTTVVHHLVGKRFVGVTPDTQRVMIDGEDAHKSGMSPMQLVLNALAACSAFDVVEMIRKRRLEIRGYRVEATAQRSESIPRVFTSVHTRHVLDVPGLDDAMARRFVELAVTKYCSVASSLKAPTTFEVVLEHQATSSESGSDAAARA